MSTILVGVDASERSSDAVELARRLASASDARVVVVCSFTYDDDAIGGADPVVRRALERTAAQTAERMSGELDLPDERFTACTAATTPAHAVLDLARAEQAELIVLGASRRRSLLRLVPSAMPEGLMHTAPCPVAIAPAGYRSQPERPIHRIGVAYEDFGDSAAALATGAELARVLGAGLEVIRVVPANTYAAPALMGGPSVYRTIEELKERTALILDAALAQVAPDVEATAVTLEGEPAAMLADHTAQLDLLVMGTHRYGPLRAALAPGVTARVVRAAHCPVIAIPEGARVAVGELFRTAVAV